MPIDTRSTTTQALAALGALALTVACAARPLAAAPAKPRPSASAEAQVETPLPSEPPLARLPALALSAVEVPGVQELSLLGRGQNGAFELLEYALPVDFAVSGWGANEVRISGDLQPYSFIGQSRPSADGGAPAARLWVRRAKNSTPQQLEGECFTPASGGAGRHYRFHAPAPTSAIDPKLTALWLEALASELDQHHGAFYGFAANKLRERLGKRPSAPQNANEARPSSELADLIGITTGRSSIQEALEQQRGSYADLASGARAVPIAKLHPPRLTRHPGSSMLLQLTSKAPATAPEPLARATPADFYYLRVRDFSSFLDLSALADSWGSPALDLLDGQLSDRNLRARYETELALKDSELAQSFGPSVVEQLAIVGSDPYLVEGSDLTLIFEVKSALLFDAALLKALDTVSAAHPGLTTQTSGHEGVEISVTRSSDGCIRRQRATVAGFELVSNSAAAIRRVISAIHGKAARLAEEPDFAYMLARDADLDATVLGFAGDRFVESVVGPQQKLKAAERELALAEASRPGYAALLYGLLNGHSPSSAKDLLNANLISARDSKPGGVAANFQPGRSAETTRGSTRAMLPLIDVPSIATVTRGEQAGYESFARSYESEWSDYIDPFAVRVSRKQTTSGTTLDAELRVLPLLRREYREFTSSVGNARVRPGSTPDGLRILLGVGKDAELRQLLTSASHALTEHAPSFDWLGDYAFAGIADRNELVEAARHQRDIVPQPLHDEATRDSEFRAAAGTPAYAGVAIRSAAGAAIALGLLKKIGDEVAPGAVVWTEARKHRGVALMSIRDSETDTADFTLYYALTAHALLFSLNPAVLETLIDQYLDGSGPSVIDGTPGARDPELVLDLKAKPAGAISTVLCWLLTRTLTQASVRSRDAANAIFRGAPEVGQSPERANELMRNYFGSAVHTPEGLSYAFGPDGARDPLRGTTSSPAWPALPAPGSPAESVLNRLESLRSEVSFDDEPNGAPPGTGTTLQSLHVHLTLSLR